MSPQSVFLLICLRLLLQVHNLLYSANWDTRIAAAATIGLLADAFPHHSVKQLAQSAQGGDAQQQEQLHALQQGIHITLQAFDLAAVLQKGEPLLASSGQVCCAWPAVLMVWHTACWASSCQPVAQHWPYEQSDIVRHVTVLQQRSRAPSQMP